MRSRLRQTQCQLRCSRLQCRLWLEVSERILCHRKFPLKRSKAEFISVGQDMDLRGAGMGRFSDQDLRIPAMPQFPQVDM